MKKFLHTTILVASVFLSINANAKSKLSINTTMPTAMKVIIDGQKFYSHDNSISIKNLQPGYHNIAIYYIKTGRDFNNYYNNGNNGYWKKAVSRQVQVRNNYQYDITINKFGRAFYDQDYYYSHNNNGWRTDGNDDNNNDNEGYDDDEDMVNNNVDFGNDGYKEDYNDWDYFRKNNGKGNDVKEDRKHNNNNVYSNLPAMNNAMFTQVKNSITQTSFGSSKLELAKQSLDNNSISTSQAKELMSMLTMGMDKLDFAKYAYDKTRDKENYFTVANGLSMQTDKDDLLKYIRDKK
jgi:Domain of unknown function (DUF4476)